MADTRRFHLETALQWQGHNCREDDEVAGLLWLIPGGKSSSVLSLAKKSGDNATRLAANSIKKWLGKNYKVIKNKSDDYIFESSDGLRKIRFDIKNTGGDKPHVHIEVFKNGKWKDALKTQHRIYPRN